MAHLIDKSAVVAEIERIKKSIGSDRFLSEFEKGCNQGKEDVCDTLRNFLDTLEVKEMDLEKITREENVNAAGIEKMSITYTQPADTCSDSDEIQSITITTQCGDCCGIEEAEKKEGCYFNISIPEGHWSVDDGDSLKALIEDFKKRLYQENII